jgi:cold shock protein
LNLLRLTATANIEVLHVETLLLKHFLTLASHKSRRERQLRKQVMIEGTVKFFSDVRGFGFCKPNDGGPDYFVHVTCLSRCGIDSLKEGQRVRFEVDIDQRNGKTKFSRIELIPDEVSPAV